MSPNNNINLTKIISKSKMGVKIRIKVSPGASKTKIIGPYGDALKVSLNAPPEKGKANHALIKLIEKTFDVSKQQIQIVSGQTSKVKILEIKHIDISTCLSKINAIL